MSVKQILFKFRVLPSEANILAVSINSTDFLVLLRNAEPTSGTFKLFCKRHWSQEAVLSLTCQIFVSTKKVFQTIVVEKNEICILCTFYVSCMVSTTIKYKSFVVSGGCNRASVPEFLHCIYSSWFLFYFSQIGEDRLQE